MQNKSRRFNLLKFICFLVVLSFGVVTIVGSGSSSDDNNVSTPTSPPDASMQQALGSVTKGIVDNDNANEQEAASTLTELNIASATGSSKSLRVTQGNILQKNVGIRNNTCPSVSSDRLI